MAYTTGTADSYPDLLIKLRSAATAQGWASASPDGRTLFLNDPAGTGFFSLRAFPLGGGSPEVGWYDNQSPGNGSGEAIAVIGNTGYNSGLAWNNQPGNSIANGPSIPSGLCKPTIFRLGHVGPYVKYHVFATPTFLHMVVETVTGMFGHLMIGTLDKEGTAYTGGQYTAASFFYVPPVPDVPINNGSTTSNALGGAYTNYPFSSTQPQFSSTRLRVDDIDGNPSPYWGFGRVTNADVRLQGTIMALGGTIGHNSADLFHPDTALVLASRNSMDGSTQLVPHSIYLSGAQQRSRYIGSVPGMAVCDMDYLTPGSILTFGSEQWMVFPAYRKGPYAGVNDSIPTAQLLNSSLTLGYAYKVSS